MQRSFPGPPPLDGRGHPLCSSDPSWLCGAKSCGCSQPGVQRVLAGRLDRQRGRTTSKPEGGCHGPDPGAGIWQCQRNARTIRDAGGLHVFLGNENRQRSQLKSCHPIWQRQRKTISDIYEYADWADTSPLGWERGGRVLPSGVEA